MKKSNAELINQSSGNVEWLTPPEILEAARQTLGEIDLDPATTSKANERVRARRIYTAQHDGLRRPWCGNVWLNWPFSRKNNCLWVKKLLAEYEAGRVTAACCICFSSTSERWFQPLLAFPQCFLHRRTNYLLPDGRTARGCTRGSVVTYLGPDPEHFKRGFADLGTIKGALVPHVSAGYQAIKEYCLRSYEAPDRQQIEFSQELHDYAAAPRDLGWGIQKLALPRSLQEVDFEKLIDGLESELSQYSMHSLYEQQANAEFALHCVKIVRNALLTTRAQRSNIK